MTASLKASYVFTAYNIIKEIYIAQVHKGHKCAMLAEMAVWLRVCLCLYSYLRNGKVFPCSLPSVGPGADPSVQAVTHTHTRLTAPFPGLPGWAGTRKVKPIWILLKQEKVSGSGISWAICKSAPCTRQITTPAPHHSVFYRPDALPAAQPTASKH